MPPDPVRTADARASLAKSAQDLRRVDILLAANPPDPEGALFHSQQAAEKSLKGFLTWHDIPFRGVHELDEIGKQCVRLEYAWRFRYPGAPYEPTYDEAVAALNLARELTNAICLRLPPDVRPL